MRATFLLSLLLTFLTAFSQQISRIDSLRKALKSASLREQFDILNDIGFAYRLSYPDSTIWYCTRAFEIGQELKLNKDLSKPLSFIGLAKAYKGDFKSSFDYHIRAIEVAREQNDTIQLAYGYNNFGRLFFDQGDYERAFKNLIEALQLFEKKNDATGLAYVYRSLSHIYKSQNDFEKALDMSLKAYNLRKKVGEPRTLLSSLMELGLVYSELKNFDEAEKCFRGADSIAVKIKDQVSQTEVRLNWAEFLMRNNQLQKADEMAELAYQQVLSTNNTRLRPRAELLMGMIDYHLKRYDEAEKYLLAVLNIDPNIHLHLQRDANYYLSKIMEQRGKIAEANRYTNQYLILKEKLTNVDLARQIEKLQFQLEMEKKESENSLLKANEARNQSIIRAQRIQNITLIIIIILTSVLILVLWYNNKKRREATEQLVKQNLEIEKQRGEILRQNEQLARHVEELEQLNHEKDTLMNIVAHDLKSPLNRIKGLTDLILIEGPLNDTQKRYIELIRNATRGGLDLITDLLDVNALDVNREPEIQKVDLPDLLRDRVSAFQEAANAKNITLNIKVNPVSVMADRDYLTRIADNLLSNAIKFSPYNSTVTIEAGQQHQIPYFSIQDNGPGFTEEDRKFLFQKFKKLSARPTGGESSNGLGLAIVKILADRLKAAVELDSAPLKGSRFTIKFYEQAY
ncbi:MAG: tetratricopeptide repeat protein [Cyclobacteriaceae bacterium]|nr:tetratricopeptide repeat protein [Cyclobacteriaceae bacterium]